MSSLVPPNLHRTDENRHLWRARLPGTTTEKSTKEPAPEKCGSCLELNNCPWGERGHCVDHMSNSRRTNLDQGEDIAWEDTLEEVVSQSLLSPCSTWSTHSWFLRENPWCHLPTLLFSHTPPRFHQKILVGSTFKTHPFLTSLIPFSHLYHHQATVKSHLSYCNRLPPALSALSLPPHKIFSSEWSEDLNKSYTSLVTPTVYFCLLYKELPWDQGLSFTYCSVTRTRPSTLLICTVRTLDIIGGVRYYHREVTSEALLYCSFAEEKTPEAAWDETLGLLPLHAVILLYVVRIGCCGPDRSFELSGKIQTQVFPALTRPSFHCQRWKLYASVSVARLQLHLLHRKSVNRGRTQKTNWLEVFLPRFC